MFPASFLYEMQNLLGAEAMKSFLAAMEAPSPVSIRYNPKKPGQVPETPILDPVPWHPNGAYLPKRPVFTLDPSFHAGAYYVQEASSMFLHEALRQVVDFSRPLRVLDLCAAPGGKSTSLVSMLNTESLLVANETVRPRVNPLRENLEKWGYPNVAITSADPVEFEALEGWFDIVVVDAPCSGEGMFRKDHNAVSEWSPEQVQHCAIRQKTILQSAERCLAPGGILVYSTCTFNTQENGDNVDRLSNQFDLAPLSLEIPAAWGIETRGGGYQFFPHRLRGEGFFLALFRKPDGQQKKHQLPTGFRSLNPLSKTLIPETKNWLNPESDTLVFQTTTGNLLALPASLEADYLLLDKVLKNKWFGTSIGLFKGKHFIPDHALALSLLASENLPVIDLGLDQALLFLKKDTFELPAGISTGWTVPQYQGLGLGWIKVLPNRMNNYLPSERRIRMDIK